MKPAIWMTFLQHEICIFGLLAAKTGKIIVSFDVIDK